MMMYLGTPVMPDLNALVTTGLYINDLSMHDFSRFVVKIIIIKNWNVFCISNILYYTLIRQIYARSNISCGI